MGLESLQGSAHLTGQFLHVHLPALDCGQPLEFGLRLVDPALTAFLIALLTPPPPSHDLAFARVSHLQELLAIPQFQLGFQTQFLHQVAQGGGRQPGHETQVGLGQLPLRLPDPVPEHLDHVRRYLVGPRRLPPALLDPLLATGSLYADARANAVFLLRGPEGQPVGAELRGTGPLAWRGMAPGSRKDRGCFAVPTTPRAVSILYESAIDALSCHALHPDARCLSTAGARPQPAWLSDLLAQGGTVCCGFDLDATGDAMAQVMIARHPAIQRLRPSRKDWNDVLRAAG